MRGYLLCMHNADASQSKLQLISSNMKGITIASILLNKSCQWLACMSNISLINFCSFFDTILFWKKTLSIINEIMKIWLYVWGTYIRISKTLDNIITKCY